MATAPVTDVDELNRLLRALREGGESAVENIDLLFGLGDSVPAKQKLAKEIINNTAKASSYIPGIGSRGAVHARRFAMNALNNPLLQTGMKYAPVVGAGLAAGDVLLGDESFGNKAMDTALMGIGGVVGSAVPVVGTGWGIAGGKALSDLTQYLLGGGGE